MPTAPAGLRQCAPSFRSIRELGCASCRSSANTRKVSALIANVAIRIYCRAIIRMLVRATTTLVAFPWYSCLALLWPLSLSLKRRCRRFGGTPTVKLTHHGARAKICLRSPLTSRVRTRPVGARGALTCYFNWTLIIKFILIVFIQLVYDNELLLHCN